MTAQALENNKNMNVIIPIGSYNKTNQWWDDPEKIKLLKNTFCKGASDNEFQLFLHVCQRHGLDPFLRQIHAVKRKLKNQKGEWEDVMTIQTGIDGFRLIAERTGNYAPGKEPIYTYGKDGELISSTSYVKKRTPDGTWHEIAATAFYEEYCQRNNKDEPTRFWDKMKHNQLAKCAEALALRKAFPMDLSGLYTKDEMQQAEVIEVSEWDKKEITLQERNITFPIPEEVDANKVDEYLELLSKQYNKSIEDVKKRVLENPNRFWESFKAWEKENK